VIRNVNSLQLHARRESWNGEAMTSVRAKAEERASRGAGRPTSPSTRRIDQLAPLTVGSLSELAAESIRNLIASGDLDGGQRLVETQLAERLSVSRGPIRDALRQLRQEGLVREIPRRGSYVVSLTAADIRDLLDLRAGLEARAARLVIERCSSSDLSALQDAVATMAKASAEGDLSSVRAADLKFHEKVMELSGSPRLQSVFIRHETELQVLLRLEQGRLTDYDGDVTSDHANLLSALRAADPIVAENIFREHVEETRDRLLGTLRIAPELHGEGTEVAVPAL
jgi:GntR family transcriptional regulator of gluconate operon